MTAPTPGPDLDFEQLLQRILLTSNLERAQLWAEGMNRGYGGFTVIDTACSSRPGQPLVMPYRLLFRHLRTVDSYLLTLSRGRKHTPTNTHFGSLDDAVELGAHGPALATGSGPR